MILKLQSIETTLASATDVSSATVVRLYNKDAGDQLITNSNSTTFTMPPGSITFVNKLPSETLVATANVAAVSVAFNIS